MSHGIANQRIEETPIAVLDFETTGLTPGFDRVVEVGVVRRDPGQPPRIVLDTLVNPLRPVTATEIHGILDADVEDAPTFQEIAGDLLDAISGCVVSAYNVYFDIKFLTAELYTAGVRGEPPHFCLMYLRPMLGLGRRCTLEDACQAHSIPYSTAHVAACDVQVSAQLLELYLSVLAQRGIRTYSDLAGLRSYKFTKSFWNAPLPGPSAYGISCGARLVSRSGVTIGEPVDDTKQRIQQYWDALKTVLADLEITDEEVLL